MGRCSWIHHDNSWTSVLRRWYSAGKDLFKSCHLLKRVQGLDPSKWRKKAGKPAKPIEHNRHNISTYQTDWANPQKKQWNRVHVQSIKWLVVSTLQNGLVNWDSHPIGWMETQFIVETLNQIQSSIGWYWLYNVIHTLHPISSNILQYHPIFLLWWKSYIHLWLCSCSLSGHPSSSSISFNTSKKYLLWWKSNIIQ